MAKTFLDSEVKGETFRCRTCHQAKALTSFQTAAILEDGSRRRGTECRACRDERLDAQAEAEGRATLNERRAGFVAAAKARREAEAKAAAKKAAAGKAPARKATAKR